MKLTVRGLVQRQQGFALPTILLVSVFMLAILMASIGAAAASRTALDSQYYNELARQAAESGVARATECLKKSGYTPQWSTEANGKALKPGVYCDGTGVSYSLYIVDTPSVRTTFSIDAPAGSGIGSNLKVVGTTELLRTSAHTDGSRDVWRRFEHTMFMRIEPPQTAACPDGFIAVPGSTTYGTSDFCVGKYEARNIGGNASNREADIGQTPYVNINQNQALTAAGNACAGCHLISEAEWLTIAQNVANVASNWSSGIVGVGSIFLGHTDNSPAQPLTATLDDDDGYFGTGNSSGNQRRTLRLNNGEVIWDFSGNVTEWTSGQTTGGQPGTATTFGWRNWNTMEGTGTLSPSPFPSFGTSGAGSWTSSHGIGQVYSDSDDAALRGFLRGGSHTYGSVTPGIYALYLAYGPTQTFSNIGFRVAY